MHARWLSFVTWALLAASLAYWTLMISARGPQGPQQTRPALAGGMSADWTRVFATPDQPAVEAPVSTRFQLLGVVAPSTAGHPGEGVALIAVDGAPAKPVRIGQILDGDLQLLEVTRHGVGLGQNNNITVRLSLSSAAGATTPGQMSPPAGMMPAGGPGMPPQGGGAPMQMSGPGPGGPEGGVVNPLAVGGSLPTGPVPQVPQNEVSR